MHFHVYCGTNSVAQFFKEGMMAEENKSSGSVTVFVGGVVFALVAVVVATMVFNEWGFFSRDSRRAVAPAPVSAVVGAGSGTVPSGQQEYAFTGQVQVNESRPCTPGTVVLVNGQLRECASSVPQTTGACWRSRSTGQCAPNRTYEQGPPDQMSASGDAQAPSTPPQNVVGP
jgi:hypothetical protein